MRTRFFFAAAMATAAVAPAAQASITLPRLFSDSCVLQASAPIPVYGTAEPGEKVTVKFRAQTATATADPTGSWSVKLKPEAASETPATLTVSDDKNTITVKDVLVGEVWICSGQSNMEWPLSGAENASAEVAAASDPLLRMFTVPKHVALTTLADVDGGEWQAASPGVAGGFSAVGYYFAKHLRESRHVPIGMIHTSWGGTRIQAWMGKQTLVEARVNKNEFLLLDPQNDPAAKAARDAAEKRHAELRDRWKAAGSPNGMFSDPGISEEAKGWSESDMGESEWKVATVPGVWDKAGIPDLEAIDGGVWFRKTLILPDDDAGKSAVLTLGAIDDFDTTFVNGVKVGATGEDTPDFWSHPRRYTIPAGVLKAGRNLIAVRVWDHMGDGGMTGPIEAMRLSVDNGVQVPLAGQWLFRVENMRPSIPAAAADLDANTATVLYNGMLAPLAPYGIRGFLWYQGESNGGEPALYKTLLPAMIGNWRTDFHNPTAPFLIVQLAPWKAEGPTGTSWAFFREAQNDAALSVKNAGIAVITDAGDVEDIHPRKKKPVGDRLALLARRIAYKEKVISSPMVKDWEREVVSMKVTFDDIGKGLMVPATARGVLTGWEICGGDGVYHPATAIIIGKKKDQVRVASPQVAIPFHLRYGWANVPTGNLYNSEGLPASPFRTDVPLIPVEGR